jgi:26S proteasome regulatory subunit T3
MVESDV